MAVQLAVRVERELKDRFSRLAQSEGKSSSEVIRDLMVRYVSEHDIAGYIEDVWARAGHALTEAGSTVDDVPRAIAEVRKSRP